MKTLLRTALAVFALSSVAVASASDSVSVKASRDLSIRVAVVDNSKRVESRGAVHDALATSFSATMSRECQTPVRVKLKLADATRASDDLRAGVYDAAVVIGMSLPQPLLKSDLLLLKASDAKSKDLNRTFYLVARTDDPAMNKVLEAAFEQALNSGGFQEALNSTGKTDSNLAINGR
jgi:hypothetical protein